MANSLTTASEPDAARVRPPSLRARDAQRLIDIIGLRLAPAAVAATMVYSHTREVGSAMIVLASILVAAQVVERRPHLPLHLLPASRVLVGLIAPLAGGLLAVAICAAAAPAPSLGLMDLQAPVIGAWLTMAMGAWVKMKVEEDARVRIAVIGPSGFAVDLAAELEGTGIRSREVIGWIGPEGIEERLTHLGRLADIRDLVIEHRIELLVCAPEWQELRDDGIGPSVYEWVADSCLDLPVRMLSANQLYEDHFGHVPLGTISGAWFRSIMHPNFRTTSPLQKRAFDLAAAALMAVVALPLVAVAAVAIKLFDRGPILYRQRRLGEHGREFEIVKLRTMRVDAEAGGPRWSEADDDRVTRVGRVLRRTHVDELPQLWNVLRGEMTLVGPRPERPELVAELEQQVRFYSRRHLVKPGVTGWAALRCGYAGSHEGTAWKLCHDLFYLRHRSITGDCLILFETAFEATRDAHRALRRPAERFILEGEAHGS